MVPDDPLEECKACGHSISKFASACPRCGHPAPAAIDAAARKAKSNQRAILFGLACGVVGGLWVYFKIR